MKKLFMAVIALMMTLSASAQFYIYFSDGTVAKVDSISMIAPSQGIGTFSVSETKQVTFSPGNLQYHPANDKWRFAEKQWDFVGDSNEGTVYEDGVKCNNALISPSYNGWIDLFGWGTGNNPTITSYDNSDYSTFVDWGVNPISNGGGESNLWRTLNYAELNYVFEDRLNALTLRGRAMVNGVRAYILLPDDWTAPKDITFIANQSNWTSNVYTDEDWSKMGSNGAVLFPYAGRRVGTGTEIDNPGIRGHYSSSTSNDQQSIGVFYFDEDLNLGYDYCYYGLSVRLVKDVE